LQDFVDDFLVELRSRYAECSLIELAVAVGSDGHELVGAFQARRDGILRRHVYRIDGTGDDAAAFAELEDVLERFRSEIDRNTRLPREKR
jgi:hypothetical protein